MLHNRALRVVAGALLLVLAAALLVVILTNDDRDRFGATLAGGMVLGGIALLRREP